MSLYACAGAVESDGNAELDALVGLHDQFHDGSHNQRYYSGWGLIHPVLREGWERF